MHHRASPNASDLDKSGQAAPERDTMGGAAVMDLSKPAGVNLA